jgi:hypothetical protein
MDGTWALDGMRAGLKAALRLRGEERTRAGPTDKAHERGGDCTHRDEPLHRESPIWSKGTKRTLPSLRIGYA